MPRALLLSTLLEEAENPHPIATSAIEPRVYLNSGFATEHPMQRRLQLLDNSRLIAMAFGAIPTGMGGPPVLVTVRIGVTVSPLKFRT